MKSNSRIDYSLNSLSLDRWCSTKCQEQDVLFPVSQTFDPRPQTARYSDLVLFGFGHRVFLPAPFLIFGIITSPIFETKFGKVVEKPSDLILCLVWFRESNEIQRFERIFEVCSKCFGKELPFFKCVKFTKRGIFFRLKELCPHRNNGEHSFFVMWV